MVFVPVRFDWRSLLALGAAGVLLTATGCSGQSRHPNAPVAAGSSSVPAPPSSNGPSGTPAGIVLGAADAPPGTTYLPKASGPQSLESLVKGDQDATRETTLLRAAGFSGAYLGVFRGLQLSQATQKGHFTASFVVVFGSADAAVAGLRILGPTAASTGQSSTPVPTTGLGSHAQGLRLQLSAFPGQSYLFAWAQDNTVRILIDAGGTGIVQEPAALALAQRVAAQRRGTTSTAADAAALVLAPADAPRDTTLIAKRSGPRTASQFTKKAADSKQLTQLGYVAGYARQYLSAGLAHPTTSGGPGQQGNYLASEAQAYTNTQSAQRAFAVFRAREDKLFGTKATRVDTSELGAQSTGYRYVDKRPTGDLTGYAFYWVRGSNVLTLFDVGTAAFASHDTALRLARLMDSRASRS